MKRLSGKILYSPEQISSRVRELGRTISRDFEGDDLTLVGIMNGSFVFMADLIREISMPLCCGFVHPPEERGSGREDEIHLTSPLVLEGRSVLLVEDILDTGITLGGVHRRLSQFHPARLATVVLLDKPARREAKFNPDYIGFTVPDTWVVGYGLDFDGLYRNLPYLTNIEEVA